MIIEHKAADAAEVKGHGAETTADPTTFRIIASVTGVRDEVNDIIEPGAYSETLRRRTPKVIKDHDWKQRLGKVLHVEEYLPGDPRMTSWTTRDGKAWPKAAGALVAEVKLFQSEAGREAAERWREDGSEQQYSIGYVVPPGKSSKGKDGVRHIKSLELFEISDVLWGAMPLAGPMPAALATKMLAGIDAEQDEATDQADDGGDGDDVGFAWDELDETIAALDTAEVKAARDEWEVKYDTSPIGEPGGRQNWVDKAGGLPPFIRAIAHALIRKGRDESSAIAVAVATVKKWAAGTGKVSAKTRGKAQAALAEWERKKGTKDLGIDLFGWDPVLDAETKAAPVRYEEKSLRLPGTFEERISLVHRAVARAFSKAPSEDGEVESQYVEVEGTYSDRVVICIRSYRHLVGETGAERTLSVPYLYDDGIIELGEPTPVRLVVEDAPHTDDDLAEEIANVLDEALAGVKTLGRGMETKAGRVLSGGNAERIRAAVEALIAVLRAAGVEVAAATQAPAAPAVEAKRLVTFSAEGLPDPADLLAEIRRALGSPATTPEA